MWCLYGDTKKTKTKHHYGHRIIHWLLCSWMRMCLHRMLHRPNKVLKEFRDVIVNHSKAFIVSADERCPSYSLQALKLSSMWMSSRSTWTCITVIRNTISDTRNWLLIATLEWNFLREIWTSRGFPFLRVFNLVNRLFMISIMRLGTRQKTYNFSIYTNGFLLQAKNDLIQSFSFSHCFLIVWLAFKWYEVQAWRWTKWRAMRSKRALMSRSRWWIASETVTDRPVSKNTKDEMAWLRRG